MDFETETFIVQPSRDPAAALTQNYGKQPDNSDTGLGPNLVINKARAFVQNSRSEVRFIGGDGDHVGALAADAGVQQQNYVLAPQAPLPAYGISNDPTPKWAEEIMPPLQCKDKGGGRMDVVAHGYRVRRLTPLECERLQGFPDNWTAITYRGKPAADGPRYRAIGNSMATVCMAWIGQRIEEVDRIVRSK